MTDKLPQGWCACKLSDVCILDNGYKVKNINLPLLDAKYLRGKKEAEYRTSGVIINPDEYVILVDGENSGEIFHVKEKGILGSTFKKISFYTKESIKYALYIIRFYQKMFRENKKGTAVPHLDKKLFKELGLILPPRAEQERIVEKIEELFSEIDEGIKTLKKTQSQIKQYRQSVLKSAFEGYDKVKIGSICEVVRGGSPRPAGSSEFYDGKIPFLKVADITKNNEKYLSSYTYTIKEAGLKKTRLISSETLLLSNSGATLGVPKICTFETTFNDGIAAFLGMDKQNLSYHYHFWCSKTKELRAINQGAAQPNLNTSIIKEIEIPLPSLSEQEKIVEEIEKRFSVADELEKAVKDSLQKAEQLKQSILKKAFSGELVSQDPNDEPASALLERIKTEKNQQVSTKKGKK